MHTLHYDLQYREMVTHKILMMFTNSSRNFFSAIAAGLGLSAIIFANTTVAQVIPGRNLGKDTSLNNPKLIQETAILTKSSQALSFHGRVPMTEVSAKTNVLPSTRKTLQQYESSCTKPMGISFKFTDKEITTEKFPGMSNPVKIVSTEEDIQTAIIDILSKANTTYNFTEKFGVVKDQEPLKFPFKYGEALDNEVAVALALCIPCPFNPAVFVCFC